MLSMLACAPDEGYRRRARGSRGGKDRSGTHNPLPKALHGGGRHRCTSGGAEVWRREGAEFWGGRPRSVGGAVAAQRRQCSADRKCARSMYRNGEGSWAQIDMGDGRVPGQIVASAGGGGGCGARGSATRWMDGELSRGGGQQAGAWQRAGNTHTRNGGGFWDG